MGARTVLGRRRRVFRTALAASIAALLTGAAWHSASANLASAARDADVAEVRKLIAAGSDVNAREPDGTSPVLWAAHQGSPELVSLLMQVDLDERIPEALYRAVAEILAWLYGLEAQARAAPPAP